MLFGIIGTCVFVLTAAGAQKAGPGLMLAFAIAGQICIVTALCYAEIASTIPVGIAIYFAYGLKSSHLGRGIVEIVDDIEGDEALIPINPPKG